MATNQTCILLVEDEVYDVFFIRRAFKTAGINIPMVVAHDGAEAIEYLNRTQVYRGRDGFPVPCLVITDIKMPRMDGFELLEWMQKQRQLRDIPRIAFSSSCRESDLRRSLDLGAVAYFIKPSSPESLVKLVEGWRDSILEEHCGTSKVSAARVG